MLIMLINPLIPAKAGTQMDGVEEIDCAEQMTWLGPRLRGDEREGFHRRG